MFNQGDFIAFLEKYSREVEKLFVSLEGTIYTYQADLKKISKIRQLRNQFIFDWLWDVLKEDFHYSREDFQIWLDKPLEGLGGRTPRECVKNCEFKLLNSLLNKRELSSL